MSLVGERQREAISRRTREALASAESRGVKRPPNGAEALRRPGKVGAPLREAIARNADRHADDVRTVIEDIRAGCATVRTDAACTTFPELAAPHRIRAFLVG